MNRTITSVLVNLGASVRVVSRPESLKGSGDLVKGGGWGTQGERAKGDRQSVASLSLSTRSWPCGHLGQAFASRGSPCSLFAHGAACQWACIGAAPGALGAGDMYHPHSSEGRWVQDKYERAQKRLTIVLVYVEVREAGIKGFETVAKVMIGAAGNEVTIDVAAIRDTPPLNDISTFG